MTPTHGYLVALTPAGQPDRKWQCQKCMSQGMLDELWGKECVEVFPVSELEVDVRARTKLGRSAL